MASSDMPRLIVVTSSVPFLSNGPSARRLVRGYSSFLVITLLG